MNEKFEVCELGKRWLCFPSGPQIPRTNPIGGLLEPESDFNYITENIYGGICEQSIRIHEGIFEMLV